MADELYYDPYDFGIDADPYPIWKRLRDEAPLYYNEKYDFFAVSRFDDVERCSVDWRTYRSGRGSVLELIKSRVLDAVQDGTFTDILLVPSGEDALEVGDTSEFDAQA